MTHTRRRWLLYRAVAHLEPGATPEAVVAHVEERHGLEISLLRLHVDMAKLVGFGVLSTRPTHAATTSWQTTSRELAAPRRPSPGVGLGESELNGDLGSA